ncbi:MAG: nucleoside-diphosphate kinase [Gemmatimonadetes bacterium]|nr:nucleoside-diphosphate kinase [Gemmatimonadota bacterium]
METTLCLIKPDATRRRLAGPILGRLESEGFEVLAIRRLQLREPTARAFYAIHKDRPFYMELIGFMTSGPIYALALRREGAIAYLRQVVGATDPAEAEPGTIRAEHAENKQENCVHASDAPETAVAEIPFFFPLTDLAI